MKTKIEKRVEYGGVTSRARAGLGWVRLPPPSIHISKIPPFTHILIPTPTLVLQIAPPLLYTLLKFSYTHVDYSLH